MAIKKKKPAKSRAGAPKKRKARVAAASPTTKVLAGQKFTKTACGLNKTDATKRAKNIRTKGKKARVVKVGSTFCVYAGSKSKSIIRRRA
jgi:hypothetical protein